MLSPYFLTSVFSFITPHFCAKKNLLLNHCFIELFLEQMRDKDSLKPSCKETEELQENNIIR